MHDVLEKIYGTLLAVRPPVPATINKAGANYKSEVTHLDYSPRNAYDEWLAICEGIVAFGGDAIFEYEAEDDPLLDVPALAINAEGWIQPEGSSDRLAHIDNILTGRVFAANGPWVITSGDALRVLMPNMLAHRTREARYYRSLLEHVAESTHLALEVVYNPYRWEGMADVAACGDKVIFTYTIRGNYDRGVDQKTMRSSREGIEFAADFALLPEESRIFAELVYPHFHGDTVHFGARPADGGAKLVHFPDGLFGDESERVIAQLGGAKNVVMIDRDDAVEKYAGNSRQIGKGVLVPDGVSEKFVASLAQLGLAATRVRLFELFGKAGGGPACATLYLPSDLQLPANDPLRYSRRRDEARARRERYAETLKVDPEYFRGKVRG